MFKQNIRKYLPAVVMVLFCWVYLYVLLGDVVLFPNRYIIMNNTDGRQILFNTYWYTLHGRGLLLSNQLFPNFDVLYMTDAQASVSVLLNALYRLGLPAHQWVVGFTNILILYSIPIAALFMYGSARRLGIRPWMSAWGAFFIIGLSPQWLRVVCGHAGLAYLLYLPALIYFVLYWASSPKKSIVSFIACALLVLFIGFNNGYMLLSGSAFLLLFSGVYFLQTRKLNKAVLYPSLVVLGSALFLGIVKTMTDPSHDREEAPYGFLVYHAIPETVLLPAHGTILEVINKLSPMPVAQGQEEGAAYIGLFGLVLTVFSALYWLYVLIRKRRLRFSNHKGLNALLITSLILLMYAMAIPFRWGFENLLEVLPFLKQFRSPGRFAWIFFYVFSLFALYRFEILRRKYHRKPILFSFVLVLFTIAYLFDINDLQTWNMRYIKAGGYTKNYFKESSTKVAEYEAQGIDTTHYAAVLGLPLNCAWNSKFERGDEAYDITQQLVEFTSATAIPWVTAKLSRASSFNTLLSGQWAAHPIIERESLATWPSNKAMLLMHYKPYSPTEGEQYLMQRGTLLRNDSLFTYYRIPVNAELHAYRDSILTTFDANCSRQRDSVQAWVSQQQLYFSNPTQWMNSSLQNETSLVQTRINPMPGDSIMEFSVWTRIDNYNENMPILRLDVINDKGEEENTYRITMHEAYDYQYGQLRYMCRFPVASGGRMIKAVVEKSKGFAFTRVMLRPLSKMVYLNQNGIKTFNHYLLERLTAKSQ